MYLNNFSKEILAIKEKKGQIQLVRVRYIASKKRGTTTGRVDKKSTHIALLLLHLLTSGIAKVAAINNQVANKKITRGRTLKTQTTQKRNEMNA